MLTPEA